MVRRLVAGFVFMCSLMMLFNIGFAADNNAEWYWIASDAKYSKFYAPDKVRVTRTFGNTAVQITAWTKTNYSFAGAKETLDNYGLKDIRPNDLAYSVAEVEVNPQNRTIAYVSETFFDKNGGKLWEKEYDPIRPKEINSQEFDEDYYCFIVDTVFGVGENERRQASDRWLTTWQQVNPAKGLTYSMIDTTTMRLKDDNMIFWEWQEARDPSGKVTDISFMKKAVNIKEGTGKVIRILNWRPETEWKDITTQTDGMYHAIKPESNDDKTLKMLRDYKDNHEAWVKRYSLDNNN